MAITKWDEYLIHQTYDTFDTGAVECDRLLIGCHNTDGTLHLAAGLGSYPKANIMDAYVCVRHEGTQHNLRFSRHLQGDRADTVIGPLTVKVIEPLKRWGLYLDENDYSLRCAIEFEGRTAPYLFEKAFPDLPFVHYNQPGRYTGSITLGHERFNVDGFIGARDRSWRVPWKRIVASSGAKSSDSAPTGYFWFQVHFATSCLSLVAMPLWEGPEPTCSGAILSDDGGVIPIIQIRHRIEFMQTARVLKKTELLLKCADGKERHLVAKPISPAFYFSGAGYEQQGEDRGPLCIEGEQWDVSQPADVGSTLYGPIGMSEYIGEFQLDGKIGTGILEVSYCPDKKIGYRPTW